MGYTKEQLQEMAINKLRPIASKLGIEKFIQLSRESLIEAILKAQESGSAEPKEDKSDTTNGFQIGDMETLINSLGAEKMKALVKEAKLDLPEDASAADIAKLAEDKETRNRIENAIRKVIKNEDEDEAPKKPKRIPPNATAEVNDLGFRKGTRQDRICQLLEHGDENGQFLTKQQIIERIMQEFGSTESATKTTVTIFMGDLKQPFTEEMLRKYSASRGLIIEQDEEGRLSFNKERLAEAKEEAKNLVQKKRDAAAAARAAAAAAKASASESE